MKRMLCLLLSAVMLLGMLAGCGGENIEEPEMESTEATLPIVQEESPEIQLLLEQEWVPEAIKKNLDETILCNEMQDMLANAIVHCDNALLEQWNTIVRPTSSPMERDDGMLAIYEAACVLGFGNEPRSGWLAVNAYYNAHPEYSGEFMPNSSAFTNALEIAPYEDSPGRKSGWDYKTCARLFCLGQSSTANPEPFFDYVDEDTRFNQPLTRREAITASAKLIQAYEAMHSGGYTIPETDWDDPLLAEAAAAREAILNSPTTITKGEELILGETYTGTAYYVSNSGNDGNDGKSPETAWATLNKVEKARLCYGDAVFFQRGGTWYGALKMQCGVTYSAYGEGAKPVITGSPLDAAREEKWTLYAETAEGGKIWKYAERMPDAGVILLNGGEIVARKAYPLWNGKAYTNADGETYVVENELADLMFFSALELEGKWAALGTRLSLDDPAVYGQLYLRCDAGNPGQVYDQIEIAALPSGTAPSDKGWNVVDNLHLRCYSGSGLNCNNHSNIVYQSCEADWCGGGVNFYQASQNYPFDISISISGGGLLLFGHDLTSRNNYIHDCENKGIAVVTHASDGNAAWLNRTNILVEGNVVERCGSGTLIWVDNADRNLDRKFEDIRFVGNFFVNGSYGWRQMNTRDLTHTDTQAFAIDNMMATGEVLFENNLFYRSTGTLINCTGYDLQHGAAMPTMRGNTYVQDKGQILFVKQDEQHNYYPETTLATSDQMLMEKCVREYIGDAAGKVIILE